MGWELAIVVAILGTAGFFVWIAERIELSLIYRNDVRYFCYLFACLFLLTLSGITINMLEVNRAVTTNSTCTDTNNATNIGDLVNCNTTVSLNNVSATYLRENLLTHQRVLGTLVYTFSFIIVFIFMVLIIMKGLKWSVERYK